MQAAEYKVAAEGSASVCVISTVVLDKISSDIERRAVPLR